MGIKFHTALAESRASNNRISCNSTNMISNAYAVAAYCECKMCVCSAGQRRNVDENSVSLRLFAFHWTPANKKRRTTNLCAAHARSLSLAFVSTALICGSSLYVRKQYEHNTLFTWVRIRFHSTRLFRSIQNIHSRFSDLHSNSNRKMHETTMCETMKENTVRVANEIHRRRPILLSQ